MNINQETLRLALAKRRIINQQESKPIGSAIRFSRKALNMTLEEGAEGICSVSYLSKIENNQIELSDRFANQLMERFNLNTDSTHYVSEYENHILHLSQSLLHKNKPNPEVLGFYEGRTDHQSLLIDFSFHHLHQNHSKRDKAFIKIKPMIQLLNDHELGLFLSVIADYHYLIERFEMCYDVVMMMPDDKDLDCVLQALKKKYFLKSAIKLHRLVDVLEYMEPFYRYAFENHLYAVIQELRLDYLWLLSYYRHPSHMEFLLSKFDVASPDNRAWIMANAHYFQRDYFKALSIIDPFKEASESHETLYWLIVDKIKPEILSFESTPPFCDDEPKSSAEFIKRHLYYKYHQESKETLHYLRRDMMGMRILPEHPFVTEYLLLDTDDLFCQQHYYKESSSALRKLIYHNNQLKTAPRKELSKE